MKCVIHDQMRIDKYNVYMVETLFPPARLQKAKP